MAFSANINSIGAANPSQATRTVSASVADNDASIDGATSVLTGDVKGGLFTDASKGLSEDDFLKLLLAELQHQDPSNPMDNAEMMAQMAQLEAIQSNNNMEKAIKEMSSSFQGSVNAQQSSAQSMTNATSVSLIGKTARIKEDEVAYSGRAGEKMELRINLGNNKQADVQILDDEGNVVRTMLASNKDSTNAAMVIWDGKNEDGTYAKAGTYAISIAGEENDPTLYAFVEDVVQGVSFSSSGARLKIAGKELSVANVMDVAKEETVSGIGSLSQSSAIELLGKMVRVKREEINYKVQEGEEHLIKVNAGRSAPVKVSIFDDAGNTVAVFKGNTNEKGYAEFSWNGQSIDGKFVDAGKYTIKIDGADRNPNLYCYDQGTVDGVSMVGGAARIRMDGKEIPLADIIDISVKSS